MSFLTNFTPKNSLDTFTTSNADSFLSLFSSSSYVTPAKAQRIADVFGCIEKKAQALSTIPLKVYRRTNNGKVEAKKHPLYNLLRYEPNNDLTAHEWKKMISQDLDLRGNHYAQIVKNRLGEVVALYPLRTDLMSVEFTTKRERVYKYDGVTVPPTRILHFIDIPDTTKYGLVGISRIAYNQQTFEFAYNSSRHGNEIFKNGATPSGAFEKEGVLSDEAYKRLKEELEEKYTGLENSGKPLLLEEGLKFNPLKITNSDSQWLESRRFNREQIATIFGVPAAMLNDGQKSSYNTLEQKWMEFQTTTVLDRTLGVEEKSRQKLLSKKEKDELIIKFKFNSLMRVDAKTRAEYFKTRFNTASISPNEIKEIEDENGYEGGDNYYMQLNMSTVENINKGNLNE